MEEEEHNNSTSLCSPVEDDDVIVADEHILQGKNLEHILKPRVGRINNNNNNNGIKYRNRTITNKISISREQDHDDNNDNNVDSLSLLSKKQPMDKRSIFVLLLLVVISVLVFGKFAEFNNKNMSRSRSRMGDDDGNGNNSHLRFQSGFSSIVGKSESKDLFAESSGGSLGVMNTNVAATHPSAGAGGGATTTTTTTTMRTRSSPQCILDGGPTPVILMTMGRSGSTGIWQTLGKLAGYDTFNEKKAKLEYVGEDQQQQQKFFDEKNKNKNDKNGQWLVNYMCELRHTTFKEATFVGFKWKSWLKFLVTEEGQNTLQLIASLSKDEDEGTLHDSSTTTTTTTTILSSSTGSVVAAATTNQKQQRSSVPPIRIIRSRRNPIDVELSFYKHRLYNKNNKKKENGRSYLPAHCEENNKDCLQKHYEIGENQMIHNIDQFFKDTLSRWDEENKVDLLLVEMNVPVIFVSYDTLYYPSSKEKCGDGENEWNKASWWKCN